MNTSQAFYLSYLSLTTKAHTKQILLVLNFSYYLNIFCFPKYLTL